MLTSVINHEYSRLGSGRGYAYARDPRRPAGVRLGSGGTVEVHASRANRSVPREKGRAIGMMVRPLIAATDYWTTTVAALAPDWVFTVPTVTTTGWVPMGAVSGMIALTCMTPEIKLGAEPAYATTASTPPMVTVTVCCGTFRAETTAGITTPSAPCGLVWPSPVI